MKDKSVQFSSVAQSCPTLWNPWTVALQASLSITNSQSLLKFMSIELVIPSNHLILCHLLLLQASIFPSIRVFSNESALRVRWSKYWSFSISLSNEYSGLISFRISLLSKGLSRVFSSTIIWKHQFFSAQPNSLWSNSHIHIWPLTEMWQFCISFWLCLSPIPPPALPLHHIC